MKKHPFAESFPCFAAKSSAFSFFSRRRTAAALPDPDEANQLDPVNLQTAVIMV